MLLKFSRSLPIFLTMERLRVRMSSTGFKTIRQETGRSLEEGLVDSRCNLLILLLSFNFTI
ncbi:hypothetical protein KSP39_PZI004181 [Platanthera zijinensis]|uniref:Uncharacterized protein n=1 Tax=Platanthera zijinensis TaxID=2320716 RepID=A0AAP0BVZ1_9ASPA